MINLQCKFLLIVLKVSPWRLDTQTISTGQKVFELDYSPNTQYTVESLKTKARVYHAGNKSLVCTYAHGGLAFDCIKFFPSNDKFAFGIQGDDLSSPSTNMHFLEPK